MKMKTRWHKLGLLYAPGGSSRHPQLATHAANPLPVQIEGSLFRVFYSGRDTNNRSSVGAVDIDIERMKVVRDHAEPFFAHGPPGSFFADGVSIGNCYDVGENRYMLFMGWQNSPSRHWRGDVGRLRVTRDLRLELDRDTPFMASGAEDPLSLSYPWVMSDDSGGYRMWYGSTLTWDAGNGEMVHVINEARSLDGHVWQRLGLSLPWQEGIAQAFSRPTVARSRDGGLEMWFSYRSGLGETYRIGHATAPDGAAWKLDLDGAGIDVSPDGWDADMIAYPFVFEFRGVRYMLYNGNGYGRSGFGLARAEV